MEAKGGKGKIHETVFNVGLDKQFVPFWNGLIHLIGVIKNDVITMRYDWYNIIRECEDFEKNYLNTSGFCESCVFYKMPSYLKGVMKQAEAAGLSDCKEIAKDNDILYTYCRERQRVRRKLRLFIFFLILLLVLLVFGSKIKVFFVRVRAIVQKKKHALMTKLKTSMTKTPTIPT
jgi:predicted nucleic acid-binding Zn ribbon protein